MFALINVGYYEQLKCEEFLKAFDAVPSEYAKASEKYENGKSRAIYGVEPFHYAISTYGTERIEDSIRRLTGVEKGLTGALWQPLDYSDFNVQHTPHAQAAIFNAAAIVGEQLGFHKDWVRANKWIAGAKFNATFSIPQSDDIHKVVQGMFSGTRNTDLINTLLNRRYLMIARKYVLDWYTIGPLDHWIKVMICGLATKSVTGQHFCITH